MEAVDSVANCCSRRGVEGRTGGLMEGDMREKQGSASSEGDKGKSVCTKWGRGALQGLMPPGRSWRGGSSGPARLLPQDARGASESKC